MAGSRHLLETLQRQQTATETAKKQRSVAAIAAVDGVMNCDTATLSHGRPSDADLLHAVSYRTSNVTLCRSATFKASRRCTSL